ncbi:transposase [Nostoc flagelliforme]|uniref:transposase n=1 Tax=Nostoc flagelliforme TaxID=1306274 RepID=UPI003BB1166C
MTRRFARSPQGSRDEGHCPDGRGKNVTMIGAMSTEGIIAAMTFTGGTNASAFETYVTQVLVPSMKPGATVVMDNFSSHKVTGIREAIESVGAKLVYLSPYSPDFSPIENCVTVNFDIKPSLCCQPTKQLSHRISGHHLTTLGNENIFAIGQHLSKFFEQN